MKSNSYYFSVEAKIVYCIILTVFVIYFLPFVVFGTNSFVTVHDNLDQIIPYYKMYHDKGLFFKFDAPTFGFSEMSTLHFGFVNFSITSLLYSFLDDFVAYTAIYYLSVLLGFFAMYFLIKKLTPNLNQSVSILVATCYAILPVCSHWSIAVNSIPLIVYVFIYFATKTKFSPKVLLVLFYPAISLFTITGIFITGFWLIGLIIYRIKNKHLNINLLLGFLMLCAGYILVDLRLFYVMFILKTTLNRTIYTMHPSEFALQIKAFFYFLKYYSVYGYYHAAACQKTIIIPVALIVSFFVLRKIIIKANAQQGKLFTKIKTALKGMNNLSIVLLALVACIFVINCIAALYDSGLVDSVITKYIPVLRGFNWGRVWIFNNILWYFVFAFCLQLILDFNFNSLNLKFLRLKNKTKTNLSVSHFIVFVIVVLQIGSISLTPHKYNDQAKTWLNELFVKTGIVHKIKPDKNLDMLVSYKEFFAKDFFEEIKKDIAYTDERVVAFGFHPSVLMYNGFSCIDGYNNSYPLSYMQLFRTLIAPELQINGQSREYYDMWGGRMYLYNEAIDVQPTHRKNNSPVDLNIDMNVFKRDFNGQYVISNVEISNSEKLGLMLVNRYSCENSIYEIYLYKN